MLVSLSPSAATVRRRCRRRSSRGRMMIIRGPKSCARDHAERGSRVALLLLGRPPFSLESPIPLHHYSSLASRPFFIFILFFVFF